jgi:hypothetical protein
VCSTNLDQLPSDNVVDLDLGVHAADANVGVAGDWVLSPSAAACRCFVIIVAYHANNFTRIRVSRVVGQSAEHDMLLAHCSKDRVLVQRLVRTELDVEEFGNVVIVA